MSAQALTALERANMIRITRKCQRLALAEGPPREVIKAIVTPPEELATYRLHALFVPSDSRGLIPWFGAKRLRRALADLNAQYPLGRLWHDRLRLRDLTRDERQRFVQAVIENAPRAWRERC